MSQKPMRKKNEWLQKTYHSLALSLVLLGSLVFCSIAVESAEPAETEDELPSLLQRILTLELPEAQFTQWENGKEGIILHFVRNNEHNKIYLYEPIERDLNSDRIPEIIIACKFMDKWRLGDEDFLVIYTIDKDNLLKRYFRKSFQQTGRGDFLDLQVKDITGNGSLDIGITYMFANAGMHIWEAEDYFYIIRGVSPFDTLLELKIRAGEGGTKDEHFMKTDVDIKDVDSDEINEIVTMWYEGKDEFPLTQVSSQPLIYRACFKLTTYSFNHLRERGLPDELLQALQPLKDQEFATKDDFLNAIEQQIGKENTEKYEGLLVQYGISQYRREDGQE